MNPQNNAASIEAVPATSVPPACSYRPSVFYFRRALRESASHERAITVGLVVCHELEQLKAWIRDQGLVPPKWIVLDEEAAEKGWDSES